jgi:hypothetical protein
MENKIVCPKCGEKNPSWHLYCFKCDTRLKEPIVDPDNKFTEKEISQLTTRKKGTLPNETFENISVIVCVVLPALMLLVFLLANHVYGWEILLWVIGSCLYYRALYEVYLRYVVKDDDNSIWLLIIAGMLTGLFGGVIIATLWDIIRLVLKIILRPVESRFLKLLMIVFILVASIS